MCVSIFGIDLFGEGRDKCVVRFDVLCSTFVRTVQASDALLRMNASKHTYITTYVHEHMQAYT